MAIDSDLKSSSDVTRRPYLRPTLTINITPIPKHWDLTSRNINIDINEDDGYILSANGEGSASGVFIPCDTLSGISNARRGRLRIKSQMLYRRRVSAKPTSPTLNVTCTTPSSGLRFYDMLPSTPSKPSTDFKDLYNSLRQRDAALVASPTRKHKEAPDVFSVSPPLTPATSSPSSPPRQQRPVLHVKTSSPVGTSAPPPTPALSSPSAPQFRPSGRLPKRPALPAWPTEHYPRAVVV
ncbi:hypothetical protein BJV78DRAFT_1283522 [Lactifluus subvellereus]|nr:hypothetical protein BJV78DRAFT_1283522 [Lactifluus subvellereus]